MQTFLSRFSLQEIVVLLQDLAGGKVVGQISLAPIATVQPAVWSNWHMAPAQTAALPIIDITS